RVTSNRPCSRETGRVCRIDLFASAQKKLNWISSGQKSQGTKSVAHTTAHGCFRPNQDKRDTLTVDVTPMVFLLGPVEVKINRLVCLTGAKRKTGETVEDQVGSSGKPWRVYVVLKGKRHCAAFGTGRISQGGEGG